MSHVQSLNQGVACIMAQNSLIVISDLEAEDLVRKRQFAAYVSYGTPAVKSARLSGFVNPSKPTVARLLQDSYVKDEIERNLAELRQSLLSSREAVVAQLDEAIELAHNLEEPGAMVAGLVAKARIVGLLGENNQAGRGLPSKITVEWGAESTETIYEKTNPLLYDAVTSSVT